MTLKHTRGENDPKRDGRTSALSCWPSAGKTGKTLTADATRAFQEVLSRTRPGPPKNCGPALLEPRRRCPVTQRARAPPALTYHRAHHVVLHPEAERRFAAAGGRSLGGTGGLPPAAARTPATDPASPVRLLRRRPVGAPGPGRASPGSNARGGSVGYGFLPRHGSEESRASHVVPDSVHRPRRRENSAAARERARRSSARSLVSAPRGRGLDSLTNRRLQPRGHLDPDLLRWCPAVNSSLRTTSRCHGNDPNRASKFRFMTG